MGCEANWCKGLSAISTLMVIACGIFGGVAANIYSKSDEIVELRVEVRHLREDMKTMKQEITELRSPLYAILNELKQWEPNSEK